ncbi:MAG: 2-amino-4-hydroxy-6-hydroxymethyldihydropteridine diphosphokinase [Dehalococcoidia bacterium]|jgi:2-amino-4-hydroxy-6-hydroxymethyldihydropteridine diphosphokinase
MAELVTVYLGIGSNLGNRSANLDRAIDMLSQRMKMGEISSVYDTEPLNPDQPRYLNIVCEVSTRLAPEGLLTLAKGIESMMGRTGKTGESRPIDIDILLYDDAVVDTPDLVIPHPRMLERAFVLVPLAEIAPDAVHPVAGKTIRELKEAVSEVQGIFKLEDN